MARVLRHFIVALLILVVAASLMLAGCTRYANEQQLTTLDETEAASNAADQKLAEKEKEKAELQQKLAQKQDELKKVQQEKEKIKGKI